MTSIPLDRLVEGQLVNVVITGAGVLWTDGAWVQFDLGNNYPGIGSILHGFEIDERAVSNIRIERVASNDAARNPSFPTDVDFLGTLRDGGTVATQVA